MPKKIHQGDRILVDLLAWCGCLLIGLYSAQLQALETAHRPAHRVSPHDSVDVRDSTVPPIGVGQSAGDVVFPGILHAPITSGALSSFKGKLIILNFWATYCSPCIGEMPQLLKLQKRFGDNIQILNITPEEQGVIDSFYVRRPELKMATALGPNVYGTLARRFGVPSLGTFVWIDGNGVTRGITGFEEVTEQNIQLFLDGAPPSLALKSAVGVARPINNNAPFMVESNTGGITQIRAHSVLTPFLPGNGAGKAFSVGPGGGTRIRMFNASAVALLNEAVNGVLGRVQKMTIPGTQMQFDLVNAFGSSRTKFEVADTSALNEKRSENLYCYELILPDSRKKDLYKVMLFDIEHYLGLTAVVDTILTDAYVLVKHGAGPKQSARGTPPADKPLTFLHWNSTATALTTKLEPRLGRPVVDETGMTTTFDLYWDDIDHKGIDAIRLELQKNGLDLQEAKRKVEMFIIRDKR